MNAVKKPLVDFFQENEIQNLPKSKAVDVLDPSENAWEACRERLNQQGFSIRVHNSVERYHPFQNALPDLIIITDESDQGRGFEYCEYLKSQSVFQDLPIVLMSISRSLLLRSAAFQKGASDFMNKPFPLEELIARIRFQIASSEMRKSLYESNLKLEEKVLERTRELADANSSLSVANKKLDSIGRLKNRFLDMISHELRTPLNGLFGAVELLKAESMEDLDPDLEEIFETSKTRLEQLTQDSLKLAQMESMVRTASAYQIPIALIMRSAFGAFSLSPKSTHSTASDLEELTSYVPAELFELALSKLAEIVQKFGKNQPVSWCAKQTDDAVIMTFQIPDTHIPEHLTKHFFEPFEVSEHETPAGDLGLGPALVGEMVSLANGTIRVENQPEGGIVFRLEFPMTPTSTTSSNAFVPQRAMAHVFEI